MYRNVPRLIAGPRTTLRLPSLAIRLAGSPARSKTILNDDQLLVTLADGRFRMPVSFAVRFLTEGDSIVAEAAEVNEFGFGPTRSEAIQDLQSAIEDLYLTLRDDEGRLGHDLLAVWEVLQSKVAVRRRR